MKIYKKAQIFLVESFGKNKSDIIHARRTVHWIKKINSKASEELLVAGFLHDIERAFNGDWKAGSEKIKDIKKHQNLSAEIVRKFLLKEDVTEDFLERTVNLVRNHEIGGEKEAAILCSADAMDYLERKSLKYVKENIRNEKSHRLSIKKLNNVLSRITSRKIIKEAHKLYDRARGVL